VSSRILLSGKCQIHHHVQWTGREHTPSKTAIVTNGRLQKKPYSAVTVQIDRLTSEQFEEEDFSGIIDLIEVIRIQSSGPTEAARAIRKKL